MLWGKRKCKLYVILVRWKIRGIEGEKIAILSDFGDETETGLWRVLNFFKQTEF